MYIYPVGQSERGLVDYLLNGVLNQSIYQIYSKPFHTDLIFVTSINRISPDAQPHEM